MADALESPPSRAAGLVTVQLGAELKSQWVQWCGGRGFVPGQALRALVEQAIAEEGPQLTVSRKRQAAKVRILTTPDRDPKVRREVQFTASEDAAIEAVAATQGFAFQDWVIAATRGALTKAPAYGQDELELLTQSNAHMAQVAVDLSALRRQQGEGELADAIGKLEREVRQHVEKVSAVMAQGAQRWQLKL